MGETPPENLVAAEEELSKDLGMCTQESKPRASFNFVHLLPIIFFLSFFFFQPKGLADRSSRSDPSGCGGWRGMSVYERFEL